MKLTLALLALVPFTLLSCGEFSNNAEPDFGGVKREVKPSGPGTPLPPELLNPNEGPFSREKMLYNIGLVLTQANKDFYLQAQLLSSELSSACESGNFTDAKDQFRKTMLSFETLAAAPVGPLQDDGRFLLDYLYAWPFTNYCGVDREVIRLADTKQPNPKVLYNSKGLSAVEYLLFEQNLGSACNPRAYPETVAWTQKSPAQKSKERCALAAEFALDIEEKAGKLWNKWNPAEGHFAKALVDGSRYDSLQMALNDLTDHLFRIELVKDHKLGRALGLHKDCLEEKCPDQAELKFADLSLSAIERNLKALETVYHGSVNPEVKAFGLDDYLRNLGRSDVADRLSSALAGAHRAAAALKDESYQQILAQMDASQCAQTTRENRTVPVCALFQDVRQISILMKAELLSVLDLRPPKTIEGDND